MNKNVKTDCVHHGIADIQNFSTDWCILAEPYACPCEEEGYVCKKYKSQIHEDNTTTFEKTEGIHMRYIRVYKCTYCGLDIIFPVDTLNYPQEAEIDYNYCPYCGRKVVESEDDTNE